MGTDMREQDVPHRIERQPNQQYPILANGFPRFFDQRPNPMLSRGNRTKVKEPKPFGGEKCGVQIASHKEKAGAIMIQYRPITAPLSQRQESEVCKHSRESGPASNSKGSVKCLQTTGNVDRREREEERPDCQSAPAIGQSLIPGSQFTTRSAAIRQVLNMRMGHIHNNLRYDYPSQSCL